MKIESRSFRRRTRLQPLRRDFVVAIHHPHWVEPIWVCYRAMTNGKPSEKRFTRLENMVQSRLHENWLGDGLVREVVWSGEVFAWTSEDFGRRVRKIVLLP